LENCSAIGAFAVSLKTGTDTLAAEQGPALDARFNVPHHVFADLASENVMNWWPYFRASW